MDRKEIRSLVRQNMLWFRANVEGLTHDETVRPQRGGANPFNWIVGHIAYWRNAQLETAGLERVWSEDQCRCYRGDPGKRMPLAFDSEAALALETLAAEMELMNKRLDLWLAEQGGTSVPGSLLYLLVHEAYHLGQLGILRRSYGKEGAV